MSTATAGTCFGFEVRSPLPFRFLRAGTGSPLEIVAGFTDGGDGELLLDWPATADQPHRRLFRTNGGYEYWVDGGGWFRVEPDVPRVTVPENIDSVRREERLWTIPAVLCFSGRGDMALHAAAVDLGGMAVVIAGPRTFGKTTLAAGFLAAGYRLLTEDITCLRLGTEPSVVPGPAMLRIRNDIAGDLDLTGVESVSRDAERLHLALCNGKRGTCEPVPLRAIVLLREADERPRLQRVPAAQALPELWELNFRLPGATGAGGSFAAIADVARAVPVYDLFRPVRLDALDETVQAVLTSV